MQNALGTALPSQLLILIGMTLLMMVILAVIMFFSYPGRKKSKMKLGGAFKKSSETPEAPSAEEKAPPPEPASPRPEPAAPRTRRAAAPVDVNERLGGLPLPTPPPKQGANPMPDQPVELMRLLRDPKTGRLIIEVAGRQYTKLADVTDRNVGQFILELAAHLLAFTNGMIAKENGVKSVYLPKVGKAPQPLMPPAKPRHEAEEEELALPPSMRKAAPSPEKPRQEESPAEPLVPPPSPEAEAAFRASLANMDFSRPKPEPPPPPRRSLFGGGSKPETESALPALNLADEINEIVQRRLEFSPLSSHRLEITSAPGGAGINIRVDNDVYNSPEDIPDPEIRTFIKESIKQWERR